jgi:acrylyl-CoA reductase (NADPH)
VTASTGRAETHDYLTGLGASSFIDRAELSEPNKRPLESERWAGCIDAVGGTTLARVLAQTKLHGSVASVGNAGGIKLECTVLPFLLRGVNLLGIDSSACPTPRRRQAWARLANELPLDKLDAMTTEAVLGDLPELANKILKGQVRGRLVVDVNG